MSRVHQIKAAVVLQDLAVAMQLLTTWVQDSSVGAIPYDAMNAVVCLAERQGNRAALNKLCAMLKQPMGSRHRVRGYRDCCSGLPSSDTPNRLPSGTQSRVAMASWQANNLSHIPYLTAHSSCLGRVTLVTISMSPLCLHSGRVVLHAAQVYTDRGPGGSQWLLRSAARICNIYHSVITMLSTQKVQRSCVAPMRGVRGVRTGTIVRASLFQKENKVRGDSDMLLRLVVPCSMKNQVARWSSVHAPHHRASPTPPTFVCLSRTRVCVWY